MLLIVRRFLLFLLTALLTGSFAAAAQTADTTIWSCRDKDGRTNVTNLPEDTRGKNCRVIRQTRVQVVPSASASPTKPAAKPGAAPTAFPKENAEARASARERQREILEQELAQEQKALDQARKELEAQESVRYGDEKNYARVLERLQKYKDAVALHEKNVDALNQELTNLYR